MLAPVPNIEMTMEINGIRSLGFEKNFLDGAGSCWFFVQLICCHNDLKIRYAAPRVRDK